MSLTRLFTIAAVAVLSACATASVPVPADGPTSIWASGVWHGVDDDKTEYILTVEADGAFTLHIDPSESEGRPPCDQNGTLSWPAQQIEIAYRDNGCNPAYSSSTVLRPLTIQGGGQMTVNWDSYSVVYTRQ